MHVRMRHVVAGATFVLIALPAALHAQAHHNSSKLAPLLPEDQEIRMATSAAPPQLSDNAAVWVLRRGGHVKVRDGTNGVNCFVDRDQPESLYPICYDAEASRTILQISLFEGRQRESGKSAEEIDKAVEAALARGELRLPDKTAIAWMLSADQVIYAGERRIGTWYPHIMIYSPNLEPAALGFPATNPAGFFIQNPGKPLAHLVVVTPLWSDGKPGPTLPAS
jgi:hypothetical protein